MRFHKKCTRRGTLRCLSAGFWAGRSGSARAETKFKSGRNDRDSEHKRISGKLPDNFDEESGFADRYARRCSGNGKTGRSMATSVLCEPGRIWEKLPLLHFLAAKVLHFDLKKADGLSGPGDLFLHQRLTGVVFHGKLS